MFLITLALHDDGYGPGAISNLYLHAKVCPGNSILV